MVDTYKIFGDGEKNPSDSFTQQKVTTVVLDDTESGKLGRKRFVHDLKNSIKRLKRIEELLADEVGIDPGVKEDLLEGLNESHTDLQELQQFVATILDTEG